MSPLQVTLPEYGISDCSLACVWQLGPVARHAKLAHPVALPHAREIWGGTHMDRSPTVRGRRLMRELKRLREASGLSPDEVAQRLDFSKSKLYRIENGRSRVDADDLEDMLDLYDVRSPERDALVALGRDSRRRGWWTTGTRTCSPAPTSAWNPRPASVQVMSHLVPGIFQTPDYARAVIATTAPWFDAGETERRVAAAHRTPASHSRPRQPAGDPRRARRGRAAPRR